MAPSSIAFQFLLDGDFLRHLVEGPQVGFKAFSMEEKLATSLVAVPNVVLIVLAIFVSLPVILAAKLFVAAIHGATIWPLMAL